ncbi:MAG: MCE family protein [Nitriliruptor sp.]|uniref:MCE family protein n=1 Tax=Nitriliruptor sp. TaxID=2448056 RepID=UPI00349FDE0A
MTTGPRRRTIAALLVLALATSACGIFGNNGAYTVSAELTRSFNLFPGSPVKVLGVNVGQITDIVVPDGAEVVEVIMRIDGDVDLPADSSATVVPASLLGERYVQLQAYTDGPRMAADTVIPVERTLVPFEFDEVLTGLENFVGGLEGPEVARFVTNLADTLDGQGAQLGRTIDSASDAIGVLRDNDQELIDLAARLADLNQTLSSRDQELAAILQDFDTVAASLVNDRGDIDAALTGLVRVTAELDGLLAVNRTRLEDDIAVLTRVGRTVQRNLDNVSNAILSSAELFRHAERVVDRERGYLPLQDQLFALGEPLTEGIIFRIGGLCLQAGLPGDLCENAVIADLLGGVVCAAPIVPCRGDAVPIEEALLNLATASPELGEVVIGEMLENQQDGSDAPSDAGGPAPSDEDAPSDDAGLLDGLGGLTGGGDR